MAILSIVLGVISLFVRVRVFFFPPLGFAAIICGAIAISRGDNNGITGFILGVFGTLIALIIS